MFSDPARSLPEHVLATKAMGIGGLMHCGILSRETFAALGFITIEPRGLSALVNPVGLDSVFQAIFARFFSEHGRYGRYYAHANVANGISSRSRSAKKASMRCRWCGSCRPITRTRILRSGPMSRPTPPHGRSGILDHTWAAIISRICGRRREP
jgi:hypothetical protein